MTAMFFCHHNVDRKKKAKIIKKLILFLCLMVSSTSYAQINTGAGIPLKFQVGGTTYASITTTGKFEVSSSIKIGTDATACSGTNEAAIRYNSTSKKVEICDGTAWGEIASANGASTDTTPNAFTFTDLTDQSLGALILSNTLTISGFDGPLLASISGAGTPEFQVNGGVWVTATSINPGDTVRLRLVSSTSVSTAYIPAITIGTVTDNWSVTTRAGALKAFKSLKYVGTAIGGLTGADSKCQSRAATLGLAGSYKAILSDETTSAASRLTLTYPVTKTDGSTTIDTDGLFDGSLTTNTIDAGYNEYIWTGTSSAGALKTGLTCDNWSATGTNGSTGRGDDRSNYLDRSASRACTNSYSFYCIQQ